MYFAHSLREESDKTGWQKLSDHANGTAELAASFARVFKAERAASVAAILHDLGKYCPEFQERLNGADIKVDHSIAGAAEIRALGATGASAWDKIMAELVSYAIAGHHAGLPDWQDFSDRLKHIRPALDSVWREEISVDSSNLALSLTPHPAKTRTAFQLGFLGRMLFSCLVDADYKDTERFYAQAAGSQLDRDWPRLGDITSDLIARFDAHIATKAGDGPVNRLRREVLTHVREKADTSPGLFTLTVPTGGGKTLASLGFALDHARRHGLERIIYAIPFTSVIDQTAQVFRDVLGDDVVLEHHSAIETEKSAQWEQRDKLRLAMEDWAAPIVLTTNVQLFESLFANRSSRCRKLHHLAKSVIVLDEAQTLPLSLLIPCIAAIDELTRNYGASVVLCTATQPALDKRHFAGGDGTGLELEGRELAPDPDGLAARLTRVTIRSGGPMSDDELVAELERHPQGLVIVNSRKHALALYRKAGEAGLEGLVHLTTRQYAADRRRILADVRQRLKDGDPCRLIATSLVEAGVDLDFPRVWRAEAGLDQIAQAAGRCNREGRRPVEDSIVTVFTAPDNPPPREVAQLAAAYGRMAGNHDDPLAPAALRDYFGEVYWSKGPDLDRHKILGKFTVDRSGLAFDYKTVARDFQMIDSGLVPVIVAHEKKARHALEQLGIDGISPGQIARALQSFVVQIPPKARARLLANDHVRFEREKIFGDQFAVLQTGSLYRKETGLLWEDADYLGLEQSIF
ncbi:CRISPR-associated helicase/endonuclease Cas3 [Magnetospirillum molischianum]|uniref:CRISPR-associated helicase, Cas3 family n=1 Tax=Magnetospirillum molischianum DSM 120 TaxID=1150626 RepID=H8FND6_MAGML|nr:CRISPR-associated helicase/endonuclease Cas3 [Magnetospirillum molischianum]CCG39874.1 CRISPR-associated helicase, Cas3 family [Magnetospirillum molischianum DSM 120]